MNCNSRRRAIWAPSLLAGLVTACSQSAPMTAFPTVPAATSSTSSSEFAPACVAPLDTANTVTGVVAESTLHGIQPIGGARVELFLGDGRESDHGLDPLKVALTAADGGYFICLPPPVSDSGATGPGGQAFEVRVRKDGYRTASQSFSLAYSVWSYGGVEVSLALVRD